MDVKNKSSLEEFQGYMNKPNRMWDLYEELSKEGIATGTYRVKLEDVRYDENYKTANLRIKLVDSYEYKNLHLKNVTIFISLRDVITKDGENHGMRTMADIFKVLEIDQNEVDSNIETPILRGLSKIVEKYLLAGYKDKEFLAYIINRYGEMDFGREKNYFFYPQLKFSNSADSEKRSSCRWRYGKCIEDEPICLSNIPF